MLLSNLCLCKVITCVISLFEMLFGVFLLCFGVCLLLVCGFFFGKEQSMFLLLSL